MAIFNEMLGGGVNAKGCNATAADILSGKTAAVGKEIITGSMTDNGAVSKSLNAGGSYTIPKGYHNGSGKVTANSLASQNAVAPKGSKAINATIADGEYINAGDPISLTGGSYVFCDKISTTIATSGFVVKEIDNNRILMAHKSSANIICTIYSVSNTGITKVGSDVTVVTDGVASGNIALICLKNGKCVLVYKSSTANTIKACVITINGNTITASSKITISTTAGAILREMVEYEDNKILLGYTYETTFYIQALQISSTSITKLFQSSYDVTTFDAGYTSCGSGKHRGEIIKLSNYQYCACFKVTKSNSYLMCLPFTMNGTNITFSATPDIATSKGYYSRVVTLNDNLLMAASVSDSTVIGLHYFLLNNNTVKYFQVKNLSESVSGYQDKVFIEKINARDVVVFGDGTSRLYELKCGFPRDVSGNHISMSNFGTDTSDAIELYSLKNGMMVGLSVYQKNSLCNFVKTQPKVISVGASSTANGIALTSGGSGDTISVMMF